MNHACSVSFISRMAFSANWLSFGLAHYENREPHGAH